MEKSLLFNDGFAYPFPVDEEVSRSLVNLANFYLKEKLSEWGLGDISTVYGMEDFCDLWISAGKPRFSRRSHQYSHHKSVYDIASSNFISRIASAYFGPNKDLFLSPVINIRPKSKRFPWQATEWHCDRHAWKEHLSLGENYDFLIIWIALSDTTHYGGGLDIIPQSVCDGRKVVSYETSQYAIPPQFTSCIEKSIRVPVPARHAIAFNSYTYHKSVPCIGDQTIWTFDFRIECSPNLSEDAQKYGLPLSGLPDYESWEYKYRQYLR